MVAPPIAEEVLVGCLMKALVGVPSWLFSHTGTRGQLIPSQEIRLTGMSHIPIHSLLSSLLESSQHWQLLQDLVEQLRAEHTGLVERSFAEAIDRFLRFYQGLILAQNEHQSVLQLEYATAQSRKQLALLAVVATGVETQEMTSEHLLHYLKSAAIAYDGDTDQAYLLRSLLKDTSLSFCHFLHLSLYYGDFDPVASHFFLQHDPVLIQQADRLDQAAFEGMVRLTAAADEGFLGEMYEKVKICVRNVMMLRLLPVYLGNYYAIAKGGALQPPEILLRLTDSDLKDYSEALTAFSTGQMELLLELDRTWMMDLERKLHLAQIAKENRLAAIRADQELLEEAKLALKVAEKQKKSAFYSSLTEQIELKREILRTEEERNRAKAEEEERKLKAEHEAVIARGKELLEKQFGAIMKDVEYRQRLAEWRKRRWRLREDRNRVVLGLEKGISGPEKARKSRKTWEKPADLGDIILVEEENQPEKADFPPIPQESEGNTPVEAVPFVSRTRQPPGGVSSVGALLQDPVSALSTVSPGAVHPAPVQSWSKDALPICSDILWDSIIAKVLRQVSPRKKWPQVAAKAPLQCLLQELGLEGSGPSHSVLPLPLLLAQSLHSPIQLQCDMVDRLCVHLFLKKLELVQHLKAIKRYALMSAGDTMELFATSLFSVDFTGDVQSAFEGAVKISSCRDDPYAEFCSIEDTRVTWFGIRYNLHSLNEVSFLRFRYEVGWPLNIVLSPSALHSYTTIFVTLLRLRYVSKALSDVKTRLHTAWMRRQTGPVAARFRTAHFLRQKMHHIVMILQEYIVTEVHFSAWKQLEKALSQAGTLEAVLQAHENYLAYIMKRCFLQDNGRVVMDNANIIFELVTRFVTLLNSEPSNEPLSASAFDDMKRIEGDFDRVHRFMYNMTKTVVAAKGLYTELFLRLDFNHYLARLSR